MSYTFSRRNFMKFTALTAAAVAFSGTLTGCSNPNQPSTTFNGTDNASLSFNGSTSILDYVTSNTDKHILKAEGTDYTDGTLKCTFSHKVLVASSSDKSHYQLRIVDANNKVQYVNCATAETNWDTTNGGTINAGDTIDNTVTISGIGDLITADTKKVAIQYFPRTSAVGNEKDSYNDVYATWDITDFVKSKL